MEIHAKLYLMERQDKRRQRGAARGCLPRGVSQDGSAGLLCWAEQHWAADNAPLSTQWAAPQLHSRQQLIMKSKIPQPQPSVPKYCPLLCTHALSPARGRKQPVRPERPSRYPGVSHTWKHANTLTHLTYTRTNAQQLIRQDAGRPLGVLWKVARSHSCSPHGCRRQRDVMVRIINQLLKTDA